MAGWRDDPYARDDDVYGTQPRPGATARSPGVYGDPYAADPYASDPYAADPYARDPYAQRYDDAYEDEPPERRSRLTPFRFAIAAALVGSIIVSAYALFVERTAIQVPILVSGLAILGITLAILAISGATRAIRAAEDGLAARAFWSALLGGFCAIGAAGTLGSAVVFALIWGSAR